MEVPVISTSVGCEGLSVADGGQLLRADTPQAFAAAVKRLADDPELGRRLVVSGKQHALKYFSWPAIGQKMLACYTGVSGDSG